MTAAGLAIDPALIQQGYFTYRSGLEGGRKAARTQEPADGDLRQQRRHGGRGRLGRASPGLDVPRDLSVVGFDDTPTATTVWPELTTVRQPIAAMAGSAIELLLRSIRQRKDGEARVVSDHVMAHV